MKLLILGGTVFVGLHLVEAALARGHEVTLFNRGKHNSDLFPEVEKLRGDRDGDLTALEGRRWDAVIDTSGYVPRIVRASAELLSDQVDHYTFISTISVFADTSQHNQDESGTLGMLEDESVEEVNGQTYGPLKVLCERAVLDTYPDRALIVRPGLIVGPHDPTNRFTYWPRRVAQGGDVLAPGGPGVPTQFIDARDLADWTIRMVEQQATGIYNATGPDYTLTLGDVMQACKEVTGSDAIFTWASEEFLLEHSVVPFMEMPLWVPAEAHGLVTINCQRAFDAGLTFRPLTDTVRDTLEWDATLPAEHERRAGMPPEREKELLKAWGERTGG